MILTAITALLPVFFVLGLGYIAGRAMPIRSGTE